jgi:hypothetical protein
MAHPNKRIRTLIVSPPLVISAAELDDGLARIEESIAAAGRVSSPAR